MILWKNSDHWLYFPPGENGRHHKQFAWKRAHPNAIRSQRVWPTIHDRVVEAHTVRMEAHPDKGPFKIRETITPIFTGLKFEAMHQLLFRLSGPILWLRWFFGNIFLFNSYIFMIIFCCFRSLEVLKKATLLWK